MEYADVRKRRTLLRKPYTSCNYSNDSKLDSKHTGWNKAKKSSGMVYPAI